jgi:hypothetical protein
MLSDGIEHPAGTEETAAIGVEENVCKVQSDTPRYRLLPIWWRSHTS